jgi:hypothetical protein
MTTFVALLFAAILLLPIFGVAILFAVRRSTRLRGLFRTLLLGGVAGAGLAACVGFSRSTVPIAPYESGGAWPTLLTSLAIFLPSGFGLGVLVSALLVIPVTLAAARLRSSPADQQAETPHSSGMDAS